MARKILFGFAVVALVATSSLTVASLRGGRTVDARSTRGSARGADVEAILRRLSQLELRLRRLGARSADAARRARRARVAAALGAPSPKPSLAAPATRARAATAGAATPVRAPEPPASDAEKRVRARQARARALAQERKQFEALYQRFVAASVDGVWAQKKGEALRAAFSSTGAEGVRLDAVSCRTSRCAVDLRYAGRAEATRDRAKVLDWLHRAGCAFTMQGLAHSTAARPRQRIFLRCARR